jgi:hypothetical protein
MTLNNFHEIQKKNAWSSYAKLLLKESTLSSDMRSQFDTYWIMSGHHMREQIADDQTLVCLRRHILPVYDGGAIELFRGENKSRLEQRSVGFARTPNIETARMFARGLNAVNFGGVLLKAKFDAKSIISGPNKHSQYLGEEQFTVDPFASPVYSIIESFPSIS